LEYASQAKERNKKVKKPSKITLYRQQSSNSITSRPKVTKSTQTTATTLT
ncbi:15655_t:CDS:2, partial [Dentiscutata erythropus]